MNTATRHHQTVYATPQKQSTKTNLRKIVIVSETLKRVLGK